jgi:hypothetical protein
MKLRIKQAGVYNDHTRHARALQPGDQLVTDRDYAQDLVDDDLAEWLEEAVAEVEPPRPDMELKKLQDFVSEVFPEVQSAIDPAAPFVDEIIRLLTPADAPTHVSAAALSDTQIALAWQNNAANAGGVLIERSLDGATYWTQVGGGAPDLAEWIDVGLAPETLYAYRVSAVGASGSSASEIAWCVTQESPAPPEPIEPPVDPVEPPSDPVDPPADPVEPPADPVEPPADPVEPPADPIDPQEDPGDTPLKMTIRKRSKAK